MAVAWLAAVLALVGCKATDVGAPCNHGFQDAPQQPVVTYPVLSCNNLMCVYNEDIEVPSDPCTTDADCNEAQVDARFTCSEGQCRIRDDFVLSRSMCSQRCDSDDECQGGYEGTQCQTGFACARVQRLGDFCCEKLCVCRDDLGSTAEIDQACEGGQLSCCEGDPRPSGCGG
jgi:hypothetical protein